MKASISKHAFWVEHLKNWQQSGLSQQAYCSANNLTPPQFWYWKRKLLKPGKPANNVAVPPVTTSSRFVSVEVECQPASTASSLTLQFPDGISITGINEHNIEVVRQLSGWIK